MIEFKLGNALDMPFPDKSFDVVWSQDAWCHIPDKEKLIRQCARVIKPGGVIAFTDEIAIGDLTPEDRERLGAITAIFDFQTLESYAELLKANGFSILEKEDMSRELYDAYRSFKAEFQGELKDRIIEKFGLERYRVLEEEIDLWVSMENKVGRGRFIARKI